MSQTLPQLHPDTLARIMAQVLADFAYLPSEPAQASPERAWPGRQVWLHGPENLLVVVSAQPGLPELLAESASGESASPGAAEDALQELTNQFCGHLLTEVWGERGPHFKGFLPKAADPKSWPVAPNDFFAALNVEGLTLTISLWRLFHDSEPDL